MQDSDLLQISLILNAMYHRILCLTILVCTTLVGCSENESPKVDEFTILIEDDYLKPTVRLIYLGYMVQDEIIIDSITVNEIGSTVNSLDWNEVNVIWLENDEGDVLEIGGSIIDGLVGKYFNYDHNGNLKTELVSSYPIRTVDNISTILRSGLEKPETIRQTYFNR